MTQLRQPDGFIRFVLWAGSHKRAYISLFGVVMSVLCAVALMVMGEPVNLGALAIAYFGGGALAWFFWHLTIWPTYAAYPGNTILPPHVKDYDDSRIRKNRDAA